MVHLFMPVLVAGVVAAGPCINFQAQNKDPLTCLKSNPSVLIIAGDIDGPNPHGPNPNGDDPHDEQHTDKHAPGDSHDENHDSNLPANRDKDIGRGPKDIHGGN